jgi:hypothetical protein
LVRSSARIVVVDLVVVEFDLARLSTTTTRPTTTKTMRSTAT